MSWKQCFSKLKMEIGGEKSSEKLSEFLDLKGCSDINHLTMWVLEWGLLNSMKLKHKMKLWTNMKFSPYQNQEWWGVVLRHMSCDQWIEPVARYQHIIQVVSSVRVTCFQEIHPCLSIKAKWVLLPLKFDARKGSILWNIHSCISRTYFLDTKPNDWGAFRMGTTYF
jgi:hypothetical protein